MYNCFSSAYLALLAYTTKRSTPNALTPNCKVRSYQKQSSQRALKIRFVTVQFRTALESAYHVPRTLQTLRQTLQETLVYDSVQTFSSLGCRIYSVSQTNSQWSLLWAQSLAARMQRKSLPSDTHPGAATSCCSADHARLSIHSWSGRRQVCFMSYLLHVLCRSHRTCC